MLNNFSDEEIEERALKYYETAREQGSLIPEEQLMTECRALAVRDLERLKAIGDEPLPHADEAE